MCGVAGVWRVSGAGGDIGAWWYKAVATLRHRGPDDCGVYFDRESGIGLGHTRLSILDLSREGHQPMTSASGRYVIVYNGEIYNHGELSKDLASTGVLFRGRSDTEVLLAGIEAWGLNRTLERSIGMFALALWDKKEKSLSLARDRVGIKPLYFGWTRSGFAFASELKAFKALPEFDNTISRDALAAYLKLNYVPAPWSIFEGIYKLRPGTVLRVSRNFAAKKRGPGEIDDASEQFWSPKDKVQEAISRPYPGSFGEASVDLEKLLLDAVGSRMVADVPLGALLSGGIDSSTVVALMQAQSSRPVKTFSIGFEEQGFDEARYAKAVAAHLSTDHTELYVSPKSAREVIPHLAHIYDEPFSDPSQIPTYLVSRLTRQEVTVALSGDGGDELFGGYNRYVMGDKIWRTIGSWPLAVRRGLARAIRLGSPETWDSVHALFQPVVPENYRFSQPGHKMHRLADVICDRGPNETYNRLISQWMNPERLVPGSIRLPTATDDVPQLSTQVERMMWMDFVSYLPDDILTKVDRASMAVSLEARVPLLDHRVVEFAWRLPLNYKIHNGVGKQVLRDVLYRYVPRELIERPKQGFGIPLEDWLRGPLREWAEDSLSENRLREQGFFDPVPIRKAWGEHLSGQRNHGFKLWSILMFQAWLSSDS